MKAPIIIYSAFFDRELPPEQYGFYMNLLPAKEKDKIVKFRRWEDATASLLGKVLLQQICADTGMTHVALADMEYTQFNKPFFGHGLHFNIAHSGNYVVCAVSPSGEVGIDIEQIKATDMEYYRSILSPRELEGLNGANDAEAFFYNIWAKKEAVIKADGRGLGIPLSDIDTTVNPVRVEDTCWYTQKIDIHPGYAMYIAHNENQTPYKHTQIEIQTFTI